MTIAAGENINASDFVDLSAGAGDEGKVPKLNADGLLDSTFIPTRFEVTSLIPIPDFAWFRTSRMIAGGGNTTLDIARYRVTLPITPTKISVDIFEVVASGIIEVAMFSEDGQTRIFTVQSSSISSTGVKTFTISPGTIQPGIYYIGVLQISTAQVRPNAYQTADASGDVSLSTLFNGVSSEPDRIGTIAVTADTMPSTIDPNAITSSDVGALMFRLDA